jgi:uncharacterized membrane protein YhaH (DUF805 family)
MSLGYVWFSFEGRINRSTYWFWYFVPALVLVVAVGFLDPIVGTVYMTEMGDPIGIMSMVLGIAMIWPGLAAGAKRCHDRDRSGWLQLIYLIPFIGAIWMFISLGFLKGTEGENRFGPDPLGGTDWAPDAMAQSDT